MAESSERPDGEGRLQRRVVLPLCLTVFFSVLNGTMFNVAIPDMARQFELGPAEVSWVLTGYIVIFALAAVTYGKLADRFPLRRLITVGLLLFNAGALLGFLSGNYLSLIAGRMVQAAGGGAIPALGMLIATRYFPLALRGRVLGAIASTVAFAAGVGPVVGGFIAGTWHWHYLFLLSNATLLILPLFRRLLPEEPTRPAEFDLPGAALLAGAVGFLLAGLAQGAPALFLPGAVFLFGFVLRIRTAAAPFVRPRLFANGGYRNGLLTTFIGVGTIFGLFFLVPLLLRQVHDLDTWSIGMAIFPGAMSAAVLGNIGGRLADRIGGPLMVRGGLALLLSGYLLLALWSGISAGHVTWSLIVCYTGFAFLQASLAKTVSSTLRHPDTGVGMGFYNLVFFTSGAFGAAIVGKGLDLLLGPFGQPPVVAFRWLFLACAGAVVLSGLIFHLAFPSR